LPFIKTKKKRGMQVAWIPTNKKRLDVAKDRESGETKGKGDKGGKGIAEGESWRGVRAD